MELDGEPPGVWGSYHRQGSRRGRSCWHQLLPFYSPPLLPSHSAKAGLPLSSGERPQSLAMLLETCCPVHSGLA